MRKQIFLGVAFFSLMCCCKPVLGVIPAVIGPVQALLAILPQLLGLLGAMAIALLKPETYRFIFKYAWVHKITLLLILCCVYFGFWTLDQFSTETIGKLKGGVPWTAVGGGPERLGCVPGSVGPLKAPTILWNRIGRKDESIDCCPAIVGNRVYYGTYVLKAVGKCTGTIVCRDTDTGGLVWVYDGADLPGGTFNPIFSSPALGGIYSKDSTGKIIPRYLVIGEGFHTDLGRITCLDLEPTYKNPGKGKPKVVWVLQALCHVESSPCIFEGKVYVGSGDDGLWCADLETGKVQWHLDGFNSYYVLEDGVPEKLRQLAGKNVLATGKVVVIGQTYAETGIITLALSNFIESPNPPQPPLNQGNGFERSVYGKVVIEDQQIVDERTKKKQIKTSGIKIEVGNSLPDVESSPIGGYISKEGKKIPCVIFGCGVDGNKVVCCNAENGEKIWEYSTKFPAFGSPTIFDNHVIIGLGNGDMIKSDAKPVGMVACLGLSDGKESWTFKPNDSVIGCVPVKDGRAYACSRDGSLYVLKAEDGSLIKKVPLGSPMVCSPSVTENGIYVTNNLGKVICLDRQTNSLQWSYNLTPGRAMLCSTDIATGRIFVGSDRLGFSCIGEGDVTNEEKPEPRIWSGRNGNAGRTGEADSLGAPNIESSSSAAILWQAFPPANYEVSASLAANETGIFVHGRELESGNNFVAKVDPSKGTIIWKKNTDVPIRELVVTKNDVFASARDSSSNALLLAFNEGSGEQLWQKTINERDDFYINLPNPENILATSKSGIIHSFDSKTGNEKWRVQLFENVLFPLSSSNDLTVAVLEGRKPQLVCLDDSSGGIIWKKTLPQIPTGAPVFSENGIFLVYGASGEKKGKVVCYDVADGESVWEQNIPGNPFAGGILSVEFLAVPTLEGKLYGYSLKKGDLMSDEPHNCGSNTVLPAVGEGIVLYASENRAGAWNSIADTTPWEYLATGSTSFGKPLSQPLVLSRKMFLLTEKLGLIEIGEKEKNGGLN
ncbi:MAG: PQQ-binding-like beta-propeller repeat protein [Candidatus Riflebacteria bacterium]|nr:PQQ-binding-like beta-propeller repeat protein [Candidatus Riflebacteria bacterium]